MLDFNFSEEHAQAYAMGLKNFTGIVINAYQNQFCIELHLDYSDRQIAKDFGAHWEPNLKAWILQPKKVGEAADLMLKIQRDDDLANALAVYDAGRSIPCYIEARLEKHISKAYTLKRSGLGKKKEPKTTEDQVIVIEKKEEKIPNEYKIGLLMSEDGIEGFSVKCPYSDWHIYHIKKMSEWVGGKAKWHADKKIWQIPLSVVNLFNDEKIAGRRAAHEFFQDFDFTKNARSYFPEKISVELVP
jgi:hypothetical protein